MSTIYTPNTGLIRGVQHFYTATKPTTRPNGSALVIGDRWWKTDEGTEWFWNGTYWLSTQLYESNSIFSGSSPIGGATTTWAQLLSFPDKPIFVTRQYHFARFVPSAAGDGYVTQHRFTGDNDGLTIPPLPELKILAPDTTTYTYKLFGNLNTFYDLPGNNTNIIRTSINKIGTPSAWAGSSGINYRIVAL